MHELSRREMIELAVLGLCLPSLGCFERDEGVLIDASATAPTQSQAATIRVLADGRKTLKQAQKCGAIWLEAQVKKPRLETVFEQLFPDVKQAPEQSIEQIKTRHISDIEADRFETVAGWTLSRTETQLYALLSLSGA